MPEISRFFGVVVTMHDDDHSPAHFHVRYEQRRAAIGIRPLRVLVGDLPPRVLGFITEWAALHETELLEDWRLAREQQPLRRIAPLQ